MSANAGAQNHLHLSSVGQNSERGLVRSTLQALKGRNPDTSWARFWSAASSCTDAWLSAESLPSGWGLRCCSVGGCHLRPGLGSQSSQPVPAAVRPLSPSKPAGGALPSPDPLLKELADNLHFESFKFN